MYLGIHQMNARSWETLVPSILKAYLLRTVDTIPCQKNKFIRYQENNAIVNSSVDEILQHKMKN